MRVRESLIMLTRLTVLGATLSLVALVTVASAAGANQNHGKSLFRSTCKTCHIQGGGAKDLTPMSKTQAQWERVFKANITTMAKRVETKTKTALKPADIEDMRAYLVSHAADSDQPETCGIK
jgi:mono/diheme cytochrome c family protein